MMAVAEMPKQTVAVKEETYFVAVFKADEKVVFREKVLRRQVKQVAAEMAVALLRGEIRAFHFSEAE